MHGWGIYKQNSGNIYEGQFAFGEKHGWGKKVYTDGLEYEGE